MLVSASESYVNKRSKEVSK